MHERFFPRQTQDGGGIGQGDHFLTHKYIKVHLHVEQLPQNN